jgi:hypothetical protein
VNTAHPNTDQRDRDVVEGVGLADLVDQMGHGSARPAIRGVGAIVSTKSLGERLAAHASAETTATVPAEDALKYAAAMLKQRTGWATDSVVGAECGEAHEDACDLVDDAVTEVRRLAAAFGDPRRYSDGRVVRSEAEIQRGLSAEHIWHPDPLPGATTVVARQAAVRSRRTVPWHLRGVDRSGHPADSRAGGAHGMTEPDPKPTKLGESLATLPVKGGQAVRAEVMVHHDRELGRYETVQQAMEAAAVHHS